MSQDDTDYGSEYAKSDRSTCKLCKRTISMGALRLAIYAQSPFFDGKIPNWYHGSCFFKKTTPRDVSSIRGFQSLRWEDQQWIKEKMGIASAATETASSDDISATIESDLDNYAIEYSKSNRCMCKTCEKKIGKDTMKITLKIPKCQANGNYHLECFVNHKNSLGYSYEADKLSKFDQLEEEDQEFVKKAFEKASESEEKAKPKLNGRKKESDEESVDPEAKRLKKENTQKEEQLRDQVKGFWKLRDCLDRELPNEVLRDLLDSNDQLTAKTGRDDMLNLLCDCMYFGPLKKCPECHNGQLYYRDVAYKCSGHITDWTKCSYKTQDPARHSSFNIKSAFKNADYACLKSFKFEPRKRLFEKSLEEIKAEKKNEMDESKNKAPLSKLNFSSAGKLSRNSKQLKTLIERLGGNFKAEVSANTVAVISNKIEVDKKLKKVRDCESHQVYMVDEAICDELEELYNLKSASIEIESLIAKHNITPWTTSDLKSRMSACIQANEAKETDKLLAFSLKSSIGDGSGKIKMKLKGGAVIDPDSGLEDVGHVMSDQYKEPYSCVLGLVDISRGSNSFYKLQIIEHDKNKKWFLFRAWGRVGTTIGGNKLEDFRSKEEAICAFKDLYLEKTGSEWSERKSANKVPGKFYPLEIDYGEDDEKTNGKNTIDKNLVSKSTLALPIQSLIQLIFDVETMRQQMKEFEIDLNKMPLGKISSNQVKKAFNVLTELTNLIENRSSSSLILDACNRFYTLIPHDFGLKNPTILDNKNLIKEKTDMLNNLLEIEIAFNILNTDCSNELEDPIDAHYKKLKCRMEVLDKNGDEFRRIDEYVKNTHASTHTDYTLEIEDVFKLCREGEDESFDKFKSLHNKKLLWHGSRLTNFAGILSQGLRIAPPEAPCTGYMFGKGVYFADMVSKSANYCFTNNANPTGLMLLCEVALGNMYERTHAEFVTKLPSGKHSTKGVGRTWPDPSRAIMTPDGYEIPCGQGVDSGVKNSALLYNEYIVYDTAQIRMRYLLRMKFKFNY